MSGVLRKTARRILIAAVLCYGPMVLIHATCISGIGLWAIPGAEFFLLVPVLALLLGLVTLPFAALPRSRRDALAVLAVAAALAVLYVPALVVSWKLRTLGFYLAAHRAEPLVAAVDAHVRDHGEAPDSLDELVPRYIAALPTGIPPLKIIPGEEARAHYGGNEWALSSIVSTGFLNWDQFIYYPNQHYPDVGHGGGLERIGRWAYVHE